MIKIFIIIFWVFCTINVFTYGTSLISSPSDFGVGCGVALLVLYAALSYKTKCFTNFKNLLKK